MQDDTGCTDGARFSDVLAVLRNVITSSHDHIITSLFARHVRASCVLLQTRGTEPICGALFLHVQCASQTLALQRGRYNARDANADTRKYATQAAREQAAREPIERALTELWRQT